MTELGFDQVDVFTDTLTLGNPVAVVHGAELPDDRMLAFARWTNLSETTFVLPPTDPSADYRLRIFTPARELPFAGHPTLGSARAWLSRGGNPKADDLVQECGAGLVRIRHDGGRLAFAAPPQLRSGPLAEDELARILAVIGVGRDDVVAAAWCDNGPGWTGVLLRDADAVLDVRPDWGRFGEHKIGLVGAYPDGDDDNFEVRAFTTDVGGEDPVTGSLNAGLGQWLIAAGYAPQRYTARQGTVLGRRGRVHVEQVGDDVWVGGDTVVGVSGVVRLD
ncbi:PhzF family phenazine biosynthesis protein [Jatrophihabitans fulvus]